MSKRAFLEGYFDDGKLPRRIEMREFPLTVGRHTECDLQIHLPRLSRQHARFEIDDEQIFVLDLESTNGTFVNRQAIEQATALHSGDVVHFADHEFRFVELENGLVLGQAYEQTVLGIDELPKRYPIHVREFEELMAQRLVRGFSQIVVDAKGQVCGRELLGRSTHGRLQVGPVDLFELARAQDKEAQLSELFRETSFDECAAAGITGPLFFNTHPEECRDPERLLKQIRTLRERYPDFELVFEVHERVVTDMVRMEEITMLLRELNIRIAYDDFGAGDARLLELVEIPPDILKFDIGLIRGLENQGTAKFQLVSTLNRLVQDMGIATLAEGVETRETADACAAIGIDYMQGYLFGRPEPIKSSG